MKTKIAVISDLHGNLEATKTVFNDIEKRGIDKIICLGDIIAKGTHPNECINLVREKCFNVVRGNADRYFTEDHDVTKLSEIERKRVLWNKSKITEDNRIYLNNLPFCYEFYMSGNLVRVFHASPVADNQAIINLDNVDRKSRLFEPSQYTISNNVADVVLYGHIHHQYLDKLYNKTLINVGSVGNSFDVIRNTKFDSSVNGTSQVHYLIIEGDFENSETYEEISFQFVRIPYNVLKELSDIHNNLEPDLYRFEIENGMYRDMTKIERENKERGILFREW